MLCSTEGENQYRIANLRLEKIILYSDVALLTLQRYNIMC